MIKHPNNMSGMWRADAQPVIDAPAKPVKIVEPTGCSSCALYSAVWLKM